MPINEFPYTNLHELNIDWILKIVKDFQEKYGNFDETYQEMLHNIEVAGAEAVEAISTDKDTALAAINAFLEQCVTALDTATTGHVSELQNVTNNQLSAINAAGENQRELLAQDGDEYVNQMEALLAQVPSDYRDALNQLQIINSILNENYTYPQIVQGAYPQDSPPTYISAMNTSICTQAIAGCAGRTLEINITSGTGVIRQIVYWTGWASPWGGHWESVGTGQSPLTHLTYTFPNDATFFSITFTHDWAISENISPSDIAVDLIWHSTLTDNIDNNINELKSAVGNWEYSITNLNDWHNIEVPGVYNQGDLIFVQTYPVDNCTIFLTWIFSDNTSNTIVGGDVTGKSYYITAPANVAKLRVSYKTATVVTGTYTAIVVNTSNNDNIASKLLRIDKTVDDNQSQALSKYTTIDSPFSSVVDAKFAGIIAFNFIGNASVGDTGYDVNDYDDFKITNIYYKDAFYMYIPVQGYKNGSWSAYDAIEISLADAPTESAITILTSKYRHFQIAIIPSMMTAGRVTGIDYRIKHSAVDPFFVALEKQANQTIIDLGIGDFELQDHIAHIVTVKKDGTGDYTTIEAAYAGITDSSFLNQYEIVVYPGTYEEVNLMPPNFTHTHGLAPNTVTVTSVGKTGTQPVFEQRNGNSKLSNMTIISGTGYCVHQDSSLNGFVLVNENLHCIKDYGEDVSNYGWESKTNPSVVGDGAQYYGAKFIWRNCTFENGEVACHSNSNSNDHANQHFILDNCRLVNARIWLGMAGSEGASPNSHCVAEIKGLYTPPGCQSLKYKLGARVDENEPNFIWQIIGGENKNFAVVCDNSLDTQTVNKWDSINTTEKTLVQISGAITKWQWLKYDLSVCGANEDPHNILGVALEDGASGDTIQVWVGNAFSYTANNGEYGIDANGALSASATTKIGRVYKNIFYRY